MLREPILQKPFHGWRVNQEIQKLTAIRTLSPRLNPVLPPLPPLFFYCHCKNFPPTSHFRFTNPATKFPLSTSSLAIGPSAAAAAAAYYSGATKPNPNTHFENPNLNAESLRESSDDGREDDGEGFGRRRALPEGRSLVFTCVYDDGRCNVYVVPTKHSSQEFCGEVVKVLTYVRPKMVSMVSYLADASKLESVKRNLKKNSQVVNKLEVHRGHEFSVAFEEAMKYGGKVMPSYLSEQVANKLEAYLGSGFRVACEEAIKYGVEFMQHHFPLQVILWGKEPLSEKMASIEASLFLQTCKIVIVPPRISIVEILLYLAVAVAGVAILAGVLLRVLLSSI